MTKTKKAMGVQQLLLSPDRELKALLEYLCQQSGKLYNSGVYLARQTFFKTGKLLTGKFDLSFEPSVAKSMVAKSLPSTPMQQTLMSVAEAFKSFKELRDLYIKGQLHFKPKPPGYLTGSKMFKVAYPNSGGLRPKLVWNKKVATRKEGKPEGYWDNWLDRVTRQRNHQMRDGINKAAILIVNHCLKYSIGNIVCGWNQGFKSNVNMGKKNNQKFVQMPLGKLKDRLSQLCDLHGIKFTETEEAYTSKASVRFVLKKPRNGGNSGSNKVIQYGLSSHFNPLLDDNLFVLWVRTLFKSHPAGAAVKASPLR